MKKLIRVSGTTDFSAAKVGNYAHSHKSLQPTAFYLQPIA